MKLNVRRTCRIGFAFFGILLLWQVYDSWCPTFLTDLFAHRMYSMTSAELKLSDPDKILNVQWLVGIIMACDNLAALILLPIFGNLSDRTKTPIGKRMPFILVGTFVSAVAFPFIPLFFHQNNIAGMIIMMGVVLIFMMMYRNPAVALMPDITPKPLRAKANGIINIMGYLGGGAATILGLFLKLSDYINVTDRSTKMWIIEIPFLVASVLMIVSALVLFFSIRENKIEEEMREEMAEGERLAAIETPATDEGPMSRANRRMLLAILGAEFLWFMSDNAIGTYIGNYVIYYLNSASSSTMIFTIVGGVASVVGFATAGSIADRIGAGKMISLTPESAELLRTGAAEGTLPGIPARLGDSMQDLTDRYHLLTDPDGFENGRMFSLEGGSFGGVYLLTDDLGRDWTNSRVEGIRIDRGCAWGLCTGETKRPEWLAALGEPEHTAEIGSEKAEANRIVPGKCDYYRCGDYQLRLYSDEDETLVSVVLAE